MDNPRQEMKRALGRYSIGCPMPNKDREADDQVINDLMSRGLDEVIAGRLHPALTLFEEMIDRFPDSSEGYRGKAHAIAMMSDLGLATSEDLAEGARALERTLERLLPSEEEIRRLAIIDGLRLAAAWANSDPGDEARQFFDEMLGRLPPVAETLNEIGNLAWGPAGDYPEVAEYAFRRTLELSRDSRTDARGNALWGLMNVYLETARFEEVFDASMDVWEYFKDSPRDRDLFVENVLEELRSLGGKYNFLKKLPMWTKRFPLLEGNLSDYIDQNLSIDFIELRMRELVEGVLRDAEGGRWKRRVPLRIKQEIARNWRLGSQDVGIPEFLNLGHWGWIVTTKQNWPLFKNFFVDRSDTQAMFRKLKEYRNAIKHLRMLSKSEMELLQDHEAWIRGAFRLWRSRTFERVTRGRR